MTSFEILWVVHEFKRPSPQRMVFNTFHNNKKNSGCIYYIFSDGRDGGRSRFPPSSYEWGAQKIPVQNVPAGKRIYQLGNIHGDILEFINWIAYRDIFD